MVKSLFNRTIVGKIRGQEEIEECAIIILNEGVSIMTIRMTQGIARASITDVKKSPMSIFKKSEELKQAIYILNRNDVAGVVLSQDIYEQLLKRVEELEEQAFEAEAARRIAIHDAQETPEIYTGEEIGIDLSDVEYDPNDGWE